MITSLSYLFSTILLAGCLLTFFLTSYTRACRTGLCLMAIGFWGLVILVIITFFKGI
jgi:hypothetical protein